MEGIVRSFPADLGPFEDREPPISFLKGAVESKDAEGSGPSFVRFANTGSGTSDRGVGGAYTYVDFASQPGANPPFVPVPFTRVGLAA